MRNSRRRARLCSSDLVGARGIAIWQIRYFVEISDTPASARSYATKEARAYDHTLPAVQSGYTKTYPRDGWRFPVAFDRAVFNKKRLAGGRPIPLEALSIADVAHAPRPGV